MDAASRAASMFCLPCLPHTAGGAGYRLSPCNFPGSDTQAVDSGDDPLGVREIGACPQKGKRCKLPQLPLQAMPKKIPDMPGIRKGLAKRKQRKNGENAKKMKKKETKKKLIP